MITIKRYQFFRSLVSVALVTTVSFSIFTPISILADENNTTSTSTESSEQLFYNNVNWSLPTNVGVQSYEHDAASSWLSAELTQACSDLNEAVNESSTLSAMQAYGKILIYMNWLSNNAFKVSTTLNIDDSTFWYTAFESYGVDNIQAVQEAVNNAYDAYSKISMVEGIKSEVFNTPLERAETISPTIGSLLGYDGYATAFKNLLVYYIDYNILRIIAEDNGISIDAGESVSNIAGKIEASVFPADYEETVASGNLETIRTILNGGQSSNPTKSKIKDYIELLNILVVAQSSANSTVGKATRVQQETGGDGTDTWGYMPLRSTATQTSAFSALDVISDVSATCLKVLTSTESSENVTVSDNIGVADIDLSDGILSAIANLTLTPDGVAINDGTSEIKMTNLGWYILAAGAVYDPFTSQAGNDAYLATINRFVNESEQETLNKLLRTALNTKKPLYVTTASINIWDSSTEIDNISVATCNPATLADLFHADNSQVKAYVMLKGTMVGNVDSSTFEYVQSNSLSTGANSTLSGESNLSDVTDEGFVTVGGINSTYTSDQITKPVMFTTGRTTSLFSAALSNFYAGLGGLTELILTNARIDAKNSNLFTNPQTEFLFMNGLGDVVLSDGTVVLPAIANPVLWNYSDTYKSQTGGTNVAIDLGLIGPLEWLGDNMLAILSGAVGLGSEFDDNDEEVYKQQSLNYYPYNVAFCNHYPSMRLGLKDGAATITNPADEGKMLLNQDYTYASVAPIASVNDDGSFVLHRNKEIVSMPIQSYSFAPGSDAENEISMFNLGISTKTGEKWWENRTSKIHAFYVIPNYQMSSSGLPYFPLSMDNADVIDSYLGVAAPIVTAAVRYMTTSDDTLGRSDAGTANINLWLEDMVGQALLGNQYSEQMAKNLKLDYESIVEDQYNRLSILLKDIVTSFLDTFGHIDGVLSMKDGYSNGFFNTIMRFVQEFYLILCVVLFIVIAAKFLQGKYNMLYIAMIGVLTIASFQVYAVWMPTAVPAVYNFFVNDIVEDIVWSTVTVQAERYDETYRDFNRVDSLTGEPRPYTATITLYKLTQSEMEVIANRTATPIEEIEKGNVVFLDQTAGIFVQGDSIKMSLDYLLANNTMRGLYQSQWAGVSTGEEEEVAPIDIPLHGNPYILKLTNPYISLESYYTPFCQIERAFLVNLNNFANIFRIQRNVYSYGDGVYKDGFLFNAYTNSGIFLDPDSETTDDTLLQNINVGDIQGDYMADANNIISQCHLYLDPFTDWLNLKSIFSNPSESMKDSLWGKMLQQQGYYNLDWTINQQQEEMISDLIVYINNQTKQFIINNQEQLNYCSDENAVKLVSLFATTAFTHRVSSIGYWLYPNYINSSDIELTDVLYGCLTSIRDRNIAVDSDVIDVVMLNMGIPGVLMTFFITLCSVVFIFIMTYLIPILYLLFGAMLVFRLLNDQNNASLLKGYFKVTAVTVILYAIFSFGLRVTKFGGYQIYGYIGCVIICTLCVYFLLYVVMSVISNPFELGNDVLAKNLFSAVDRLTGRRLSQLTTNSMRVNARHAFNNSPFYGGMRSFMHTSGIDGHRFFRRPNYRRAYSRYSPFDSQYRYRPNRVTNMFNNFASVASSFRRDDEYQEARLNRRELFRRR